LIEHLKKQESAVILSNSSILGFVSLSFTGVYSATKAARHRLQSISVKVLEIAPPWVRAALGTDVPEVLVGRARAFRGNQGLGEHTLIDEANDQMMALFSGGSLRSAAAAQN
jgi:short-subunit dehydrogenase involved in D-alanine esterification of teichoic acids